MQAANAVKGFQILLFILIIIKIIHSLKLFIHIRGLIEQLYTVVNMDIFTVMCKA